MFPWDGCVLSLALGKSDNLLPCIDFQEGLKDESSIHVICRPWHVLDHSLALWEREGGMERGEGQGDNSAHTFATQIVHKGSWGSLGWSSGRLLGVILDGWYADPVFTFS